MIERREGQRFRADWPVKVESAEGRDFSEDGVLSNISSNGALILTPNPLETGTRLNISIKLPVQKTRWMTYSARVLRLEEAGLGFAAAIRFEGAKPQFAM